MSADFISYLNFLLQFTEPDPSETELLARFATIGIGPGLTFDRATVPAETLAAIEAGVAEGLQELNPTPLRFRGRQACSAHARSCRTTTRSGPWAR